MKHSWPMAAEKHGEIINDPLLALGRFISRVSPLHRGYFHFNWRLLNPVPPFPLYFSLLRRGCNPSTSTEEKDRRPPCNCRSKGQINHTPPTFLPSFFFIFLHTMTNSRPTAECGNLASGGKRPAKIYTFFFFLPYMSMYFISMLRVLNDYPYSM